MAIEKYKPKYIFSLLSGGHDSMSCTHFSANYLKDKLTGVVHINTGIGIKQTREYVYQRCNEYGWRLYEYKATENTYADGTPDPMVFEDIVIKNGFPGISQHQMMYIKLKDRQIARLCRDFDGTSKEPIMLISGARKQESTRRMRNTKEMEKVGNRLWCSPFIEMSATDCSQYMQDNNIPRNPVKDYLHMSGECLCGSFAHKGELDEIALWYPEAANEIKVIESKVRRAGFPWGWEESPPEWWIARNKAKKFGQQDAFEEEMANEIEYLCIGCHKRNST